MKSASLFAASTLHWSTGDKPGKPSTWAESRKRTRLRGALLLKPGRHRALASATSGSTRQGHMYSEDGRRGNAFQKKGLEPVAP